MKIITEAIVAIDMDSRSNFSSVIEVNL
jgi:hypothetical protein